MRPFAFRQDARNLLTRHVVLATAASITYAFNVLSPAIVLAPALSRLTQPFRAWVTPTMR